MIMYSGFAPRQLQVVIKMGICDKNNKITEDKHETRWWIIRIHGVLAGNDIFKAHTCLLHN